MTINTKLKVKVTKQMILDAYAKTGLTPKSGYYTIYKDKQLVSACITGVLCLANIGVDAKIGVSTIENWLRDNIEFDQLVSLVRGFDGTERDSIYNDEKMYLLGQELNSELLLRKQEETKL